MRYLSTYKLFETDIRTRYEDEDQDRIEIGAYVDGEKIGRQILEKNWNAYWRFEDEFTEDEYYEMFPDDMFMVFEHLEVGDEHKGTGIAKQLIAAAVEQTKKEGFDVIWLNASPMGTSGLRLRPLVDLYKKFGFEEILDQGNNVQMILKSK